MRTAEGTKHIVIFVIRQRPDLTARYAKQAAKAFRRLGADYGPVVIVVDGYDDDPRELWDIPEAADYVRLWTRLVGIRTLANARRRQIVETSVGLLAACRVFGDEVAVQVPTKH